MNANQWANRERKMLRFSVLRHRRLDLIPVRLGNLCPESHKQEAVLVGSFGRLWAESHMPTKPSPEPSSNC
jgi:hypothetical protein